MKGNKSEQALYLGPNIKISTKCPSRVFVGQINGVGLQIKELEGDVTNLNISTTFPDLNDAVLYLPVCTPGIFILKYARTCRQIPLSWLCEDLFLFVVQLLNSDVIVEQISWERRTS